MSDTIIINSTNMITRGRYEYIFPSAVKFSANDQVALQTVSMYNSIFNIEAQRGNNVIRVRWPSLIPETADFVIPDGFYNVNALNAFIQNQCLLRGWYFVDNATPANVTKNIYLVELITNPNQYGVQLITYMFPTSANATTLKYFKPSGVTWNFPATNATTQVTILSKSFGDLIGFNPATYPATVMTTTQNFLSTKTPQISPVNCIILGCNLINSSFSIPNNVFYSIPITSQFGSMIVKDSASMMFNKISAGNYSKIVIDFYDQNFSSLRMNDPEIVLVLSIKRENNSHV